MVPTGDGFTTPVAIIIFNRPEQTQLLFHMIREIEPKTLFIVSDGARSGHPEDPELVSRCRQIVEAVNWDCEVNRDYAEVNLGLKKRIVSGLNLVFNRVPEAIILEDDCIPSRDFFTFCAELLERYRSDRRIFSIGGHIWEFPDQDRGESYLFSRYFSPWGWATWADRWDVVDPDMRAWGGLRGTDWLQKYLDSPMETVYWQQVFDMVSSGTGPLSQVWDFAAQLSIWQSHMLTIRPTRNLIHNLGFSPDATHTKRENTLISQRSARRLDWPIAHPEIVERKVAHDEEVNRVRLSGTIRDYLFQRKRVCDER